MAYKGGILMYVEDYGNSLKAKLLFLDQIAT